MEPLSLGRKRPTPNPLVLRSSQPSTPGQPLYRHPARLRSAARGPEDLILNLNLGDEAFWGGRGGGRILVWGSPEEDVLKGSRAGSQGPNQKVRGL